VTDIRAETRINDPRTWGKVRVVALGKGLLRFNLGSPAQARVASRGKTSPS
jgi:hypothetical protein